MSILKLLCNLYIKPLLLIPIYIYISYSVMPSVRACRSFYRCVQENRTVTDSRMKNLYPNLQNLTQ